MAEREMYTFVADVAIGSKACQCLLGALPVHLKGLNVCDFLDVAWEGGRITPSPFLLLLCILVHCVILPVCIVDGCCDL